MSSQNSAPGTLGAITLKYVGAAISLLVAVFGALSLLGVLFSMWTGSVSSRVLGVGGGYVVVVTLAVITSLFAVLSFLLYKKVTQEVAAHPEYIEKPAYHCVTNALVGILAFIFLLFVGNLIAVLISSLLLIGTSTDIGGLYLNNFLPSLIGAGLVGFVGFCAYQIMKGKNKSGLVTLVVMALAGALLVATLITVPIKAHGTTSTRSYEYNMLNDYYRN